MKAMEEELTKVQLSRYKVELEQKQKLLAACKKHEEQVREYRLALRHLVGSCGIEIPLSLAPVADEGPVKVSKELKDVVEACKD